MEYWITKDATKQTNSSKVERYCLQTFTYYDGSVSKPTKITKDEEVDPEIPKTVETYDLKGTVKSATIRYYNSTNIFPIYINNETEEVSGGKESSLKVLKFDTEGYCVQENSRLYDYNSDDENLENNLIHLVSYTYEYDSKHRVKTIIYIYNCFNNSSEPTIVENTKIVYTYDDINNTYTQEIFNTNNPSSTILSRSLNVRSEDFHFNNVPNSNFKRVKKMDNNGSLILTYNRYTNYNTPSGDIYNQKTLQYRTADITYY